INNPNDRRDPRTVAKMKSFRNRFLRVKPRMRNFLQLLQQKILFTGAGINENHRAAECLRNILAVNIVLQDDRSLPAGFRHAMIGNDNHIEILTTDGLELFKKKPHRLIDHTQGRFDFRRVGTKPMASLVNIVNIERQKLGPRFLGQRKPIDNLRDSLFVWQGGVKSKPVGGTRPANLSITSRPKTSRRPQTLFLRCDPDWLPKPPISFLHHFTTAHRKRTGNRWVDDVVADNSMMFGMQSRQHRIMAWKRIGREHWN